MFRLYINGPARGTRFVWSCRSCGRDPAALVQIFTYCWQWMHLGAVYESVLRVITSKFVQNFTVYLLGLIPISKGNVPTSMHGMPHTSECSSHFRACRSMDSVYGSLGIAYCWRIGDAMTSLYNYRVCGSDFIDLYLLGVENGLQCFHIWRFYFFYVSENNILCLILIMFPAEFLLKIFSTGNPQNPRTNRHIRETNPVAACT